MAKFNVPSAPSRVIFYVVVILCGFTAWRIQEYYIKTAGWPDDGVIATIPTTSADSDMSAWDSKAIDAATQTNSVLTTLGTAMLGAMGFLLINTRGAKHAPRHLWSALGGGVCVGVSIYFGYVGYMQVMAAAHNHKFNPYGQSFQWPSNAQFYALLLAAMFFADFTFFTIHQLTTKEDKRESPQEVTAH